MARQVSKLDLLKNLLEILDLTEDEAMNKLQDGGIVSDNCVSLEDIADGDVADACAFLSEL